MKFVSSKRKEKMKLPPKEREPVEHHGYAQYIILEDWTEKHSQNPERKKC